MTRKKALDAMVVAHTSLQAEMLLRFNAEGIKPSAMFEHREEIVRKILDGADPVCAVQDAIGAAIRLHKVSLTASSNVPSFSDVMDDEMREALRNL